MVRSRGARLTGMSQSVSFDRAAHFYDATRQLPTHVAAAITDAIAAELAESGTDIVLEIGVGTGRMARPLMARGFHVIGVDISRLMLARLVEQLEPGMRTPDIALADATRLPFVDGAVPAVLAVHVLHLVASAEKALSEIRRVLAPGGVFLHQTHRDNGVLADSGVWWDELLRSRGLNPPRRSNFQDLRSLLESSGAVCEVKDVIEDEITYDPAAVLAENRGRIHSWTWRIPDDLFSAAFPDYERWFEAHYGSDPVVEEITYELEGWSWPEGARG